MNFYAKLKETVFSVAPVMGLVLLIGSTVAPLGGDMLLRFFLGGLMVIAGLAVFLTGVDIGILPVGERSGAALTSRRNLPLLLCAAFVIGFIITIAEPDVQVLAEQVRGINPSISKWGLVFSIALGVGFFVSLGILRTILSIPLKYILIVSYLIVFAAAWFAPDSLQGVAFDSGGATTGPMTVPFILALGLGVSAVRSKSSGQQEKDSSIERDDSFGLTGIASIGPVLAVVVFGIVLVLSGKGEAAQAVQEATQGEGSQGLFSVILPAVALEVAESLAPLAIMTIILQFTLLKMPPMQVIRTVRGFIFSYAGLVIFLSGAQGGFMPAGHKLGQMLGSLAVSGDKLLVLYNAAGEVERSLGLPAVIQISMLLLTGCIFGAVTVCAEPAVWVLTNQVEALTGGTIRRKVMLTALCTGVAVSIGISMARVLFGFSLWYVLIPGYALSLLLTFFTPKFFTGIAFDSGGVASGPMTSIFILSFTLGASSQGSGNSAADAFGVIALVAMTPLIAIQLLGIVFKIKMKLIQYRESQEVSK